MRESSKVNDDADKKSDRYSLIRCNRHPVGTSDLFSGTRFEVFSRTTRDQYIACGTVRYTLCSRGIFFDGDNAQSLGNRNTSGISGQYVRGVVVRDIV